MTKLKILFLSVILTCTGVQSSHAQIDSSTPLPYYGPNERAKFLFLYLKDFNDIGRESSDSYMSFVSARNMQMMNDGHLPMVAEMMSSPERDRRPHDIRVSIALAEAKAILKPLEAMMPNHGSEILKAAYLLTLIPDPHRFFIMRALRSLKFRAVTAVQLAPHLPADWQVYANRVITYREGNELLFNQYYFGEAGFFSGGMIEGLGDLMVMEGIRYWLSPSALQSSDYLLRLTRALVAGNFSAFEELDQNGNYILAYLPAVKSAQAKNNEIDPNSLKHAFFIEKPTGLRFLGPMRFKNLSRPGSSVSSLGFFQDISCDLNGPNVWGHSDLRLPCAELDLHAGDRLQISPMIGKLNHALNTRDAKWDGFVENTRFQSVYLWKRTMECTLELNLDLGLAKEKALLEIQK